MNKPPSKMQLRIIEMARATVRQFCERVDVYSKDGDLLEGEVLEAHLDRAFPRPKRSARR